MRADAQRNYDKLLLVARVAIAERGAEASLRDVARRAGVGLGTLYRHFPTREDLLAALLRQSFDELRDRADELEAHDAAGDALATWMREFVTFAHQFRGVTDAMTQAIEDETSALHASCVAMKASGSRLLLRAQAEGAARRDVDGADLFALAAAVAWLGDQPAFAASAPRLLDVVAEALLAAPAAAPPR